MVAENLQCGERAEEIKKYFESVSGFGRFRCYTSGEKLVSDDWRQIGPCRPPRKSSRPPESLQKTRYATSRNPRNGAAILAVPRLNLLCSHDGLPASALRLHS